MLRCMLFLMTVHVSFEALQGYFQKRAFSSTNTEKRNTFVDSIQRSNMTMVQEKLKLLRLQKMEQNVMQMRPEKNKNETELVQELLPQNGRDSLVKVNMKANVTDYLYQADILLTEEQADKLARDAQNSSRLKRQAYKDRYYPYTVWMDRVYYYYAKSATPEVRRVFLKAVAFWKKHTCVKFQYSTTAENRIKVFKGDGCYSYIGQVFGVQEFSLGDGCEDVGTACHELGHALGFFHTQSRHDRDEAITVKLANVQADFIDQFDKESTETNYNYEIPYDYGSIMQYGATSASKSNKPTMVAKNEYYQDTMGSDMVAFYDILMMNKHYKCEGICKKNTSADCKNGGFPRPRNCAKCICPGGYGGPLCETRPPGCGSELEATESMQWLNDTIRPSNNFDRFRKCNYWIKAPLGKKIEIRLANMHGYYSNGCIYGGVEIKAQADQLMTGYRFCSKAAIGTVLISSTNIVPIITYSKDELTTTSFEFKIADESSNPTENSLKR